MARLVVGGVLVVAVRPEVGKMEKKLVCPRCGVKMEKIKKNGVIIDVCRTCEGMWLDGGELEKLIKHG